MLSCKSFLAKIVNIWRCKKDNKPKENLRPAAVPSLDNTNHWIQQEVCEGQLSVDVYQTKNEIVIKSAIAGVAPQDLDISISSDMVTIRGFRKQEKEIERENYLYQECYWGRFSRSIILPEEIKPDAATAKFKRGILTIRLPKVRQTQKIKIAVGKE